MLEAWRSLGNLTVDKPRHLGLASHILNVLPLLLWKSLVKLPTEVKLGYSLLMLTY